MSKFGKIRNNSGKTSTHRAENIFPKYLLYNVHDIARKYPREKKRYSSFSNSAVSVAASILGPLPCCPSEDGLPPLRPFYFKDLTLLTLLDVLAITSLVIHKRETCRVFGRNLGQKLWARILKAFQMTAGLKVCFQGFQISPQIFSI
jgi:hypothetical protein